MISCSKITGNGKKLTLSVAALLFVISFALGQAGDRSVIAPAGSQDIINNISIDWTLGEWQITSNESRDVLYTQGFHQPQLNISVIREVKGISELVLDVFPNPVIQTLVLMARAESDYSLSISLHDLSGKLMLDEMKMNSNGIQIVDVSSILSGMYIITVHDETGEYSQSYKVTKIN